MGQTECEAEIAADHKWIQAINEEMEKRGIDIRWAYPKFPCQPIIGAVIDAVLSHGKS
jgi:hypothetical protein